MKLPEIRKEIPLFDISLSSRCYGHVYHPSHRPGVSISYLIPFNIPLRLSYLLWLWAQTPFRDREPAWWLAKFRARNYPDQITDTNTITINEPGGKVTIDA